MLSARNQFQERSSRQASEVMAEVVVSVGGLEIVSAHHTRVRRTPGPQPGDKVKAIIKSTEVPDRQVAAAEVPGQRRGKEECSP